MPPHFHSARLRFFRCAHRLGEVYPDISTNAHSFHVFFQTVAQETRLENQG
jgi:hypothetical protein